MTSLGFMGFGILTVLEKESCCKERRTACFIAVHLS